MLRLNLCSGQRPFGTPEHQWVNVDLNPQWKPDLVTDCSSLPMFADDSVDMIVIHHGAEHAGAGENQPMLSECLRILKPGSSLLVFVPDMRMLAQGWLEGKISDVIYMTNVYGAFNGHEADRHKWGFTSATLQKELESIGFKRAFPFNWRKIEGADIAGPAWWILGTEAIK